MLQISVSHKKDENDGKESIVSEESIDHYAKTAGFPGEESEDGETVNNLGEKVSKGSSKSSVASKKSKRSWFGSSEDDENKPPPPDVDTETASLIKLLGPEAVKGWNGFENEQAGKKKKSRSAHLKELIRSVDKDQMVREQIALNYTDEERARNKTNQIRYDRARRKQGSGWYKNETQGALFKKILLQDWFEWMVMTTIFVNAVWIGFELEFRNMEHENAGAYNIGLFNDSYFNLAEYVFLTVFTFEIVVRFGAYKWPWYFFVDPMMWMWNWFDLLLVAMMWTEFALRILFPESVTDLAIFSAMRLMRLLRLSRLLRMLPELEMMVKAVGVSLRSVSSTFFILSLLIYVFSNILCVWAQGWLESGELTPEQHDNLYFDFGTLGYSMLTLGGIAVKESVFLVVRRNMALNFWMGMVILVYLWVAVLGVFNLLIAVIVGCVYAVKDDTNEEVLLDKILTAFDEIDDDGNGNISIEEFFQKGYALMRLGLTQHQSIIAFLLSNPNGEEEIPMEELETIVFKMLHDPVSSDLLMANRNLGKLASYMGFDGCLTAAGRPASDGYQLGAGSAHIFEQDVMEKMVKGHLDKRFQSFEQRLIKQISFS